MMLRRIWQWLLLSCALVLAGVAVADEVAVPPLNAHVTDLTQTLSLDQQSALETKLVQFEQQKGSQIAVLLVPSTQPETIEQYSIRVVEAWKLGRKKVDDGVLVLVAKDDHKMRIEVGYGLEGAIPDAIAKRIIAEIMTPYFKQGDFYGGLDAAVDRLIGLVNGEPLPAPPASSDSNGDSGSLFLPLVFAALIIGEFLRPLLGNFFGGLVNGGLIAGAASVLGAGTLVALFLALIAFVVTLTSGLGLFNGVGSGRGGWGSGSGGGFGGGGGFSGGGGGFGGGGASGSW